MGCPATEGKFLAGVNHPLFFLIELLAELRYFEGMNKFGAPLKKFMYTFFAVVLVLVLGYAFINFYSYIFARSVVGVIVKVEKPTAPIAVMGTAGSDSAKMAEKQLFSYAVAVKVKDGEIVTASTEDRQWSVAEVGKCVEAKFYPYAPWQLDKSGTFFNARLLKMYECAEMKAPE
jgi:hypothetical protein